MATADVSPTVPVSAELLLELSWAADGLAFAVQGRMTVSGPDAAKHAARYDELAERACAVLTEHAPAWLERRVDEDMNGGGRRG